MKRNNWTREELLVAFNLYCKIPFGTITGSNLKVQELSQLLNRTAGAVAMKLCNFASFDPYHKERGVKGLAHGGKLDEIVYNEFVNNWDEMLFESERLLTQYEETTIERKYEPILIDLADKKGEVKIREVKTRVNQNLFRQIILSIYQKKCAISGIDISEMLVAGHILPWAEYDNERLNPENGICLSSTYDKAFENGLIGIDENYKILVSSKLKQEIKKEYYQPFFGRFEGKVISLPDKFLPNKDFLKKHLENEPV